MGRVAFRFGSTGRVAASGAATPLAISASLAVALLAAGLLATLFAAEPARAAFPGVNGAIAYQGWDENDYDYEIYAVSPSGGAPTNVTKNTVEDRDPAYSPYGNKIAYSSWDGNDFEIFTIPATGGTPTRLTNNSSNDYSPSWSAWSPNGTRVAYQGWDGFDWEIYTVPSTGGTSTNITNNSSSEYYPAYSPDGARIAYVGYNGLWGIDTIPSTGGTPTRVINRDYVRYPSWAHNGARIVYQDWDGSDYEIYTVSSAGGTATNVTNNSVPDFHPAFSPDGVSITYYKEDRPDNDMEVFSIPAAGGAATKMTNSGWGTYPDWGVVPDNISPRVTKPPTASFVPNSAVSATSTVPIRLDWLAADNAGGSGVGRYQLQQSTNSGAFSTILTSGAVTTTRLLSPGNSYRFQVRAQDKAENNFSAFSPGPSFRIVPHQESSASVTYPSGVWKAQALSGAYGGSVKYASAANATAKLTFTGRNVAWITTRGPDRGQAAVRVDGVQVDANPGLTGVQPFDLYSSTLKKSQVVPLKGFTTSGSHTVEVRVLGTKNARSSGTRVDVDAFLALS